MEVFEAPEPLPERLATALSKIALALRAQSWQQARSRRLTPTQGQFLVHLRGAGRQGRRLGEVAAALGVRTATASDSLRALERKRLVKRAAAADDARALRLSLTPRGRREAEGAAAFGSFLAEAAAGLDPSEQAALYRGALKLIRALQDRGQIPVSRMCVSCRFFRPNAHRSVLKPHHCAFVNAPLGDAQLRIDCADHKPAA